MKKKTTISDVPQNCCGLLFHCSTDQNLVSLPTARFSTSLKIEQEKANTLYKSICADTRRLVHSEGIKPATEGAISDFLVEDKRYEDYIKDLEELRVAESVLDILSDLQGHLLARKDLLVQLSVNYRQGVEEEEDY